MFRLHPKRRYRQVDRQLRGSAQPRTSALPPPGSRYKSVLSLGPDYTLDEASARVSEIAQKLGNLGKVFNDKLGGVKWAAQARPELRADRRGISARKDLQVPTFGHWCKISGQLEIP